MSADFDPYHKWLGIRPDEQPASYYRLLGLQLFEKDPDVIHNNADRQIVHIRSAYENGEHAAQAVRIIQQLTAARDCLLNPQQKSAYDSWLQAHAVDDSSHGTQQASAPQPSPAPPSRRRAAPRANVPRDSASDLIPELQIAAAGPAAATGRNRSRAGYARKKNTAHSVWLMAGAAGVVALILLILVLSVFMRRDVAIVQPGGGPRRSVDFRTPASLPHQQNQAYQQNPSDERQQPQQAGQQSPLSSTPAAKVYSVSKDLAAHHALGDELFDGARFEVNDGSATLAFTSGAKIRLLPDTSLIVRTKDEAQLLRGTCAVTSPIGKQFKLGVRDLRVVTDSGSLGVIFDGNDAVRLYGFSGMNMIGSEIRPALGEAVAVSAAGRSAPIEFIGEGAFRAGVMLPREPPGELAAVAGFDCRTATWRRRLLAAGGGTVQSEAAVVAALDWLVRHQNRDGSWSIRHTPLDNCDGFANPAEKATKMGATGLAILTFLAGGHSHQSGDYRDQVDRGLSYLVGNMIAYREAGRLYDRGGGNHEHMYSHAICTAAVAEAYGMTRDAALERPAQMAVNYIAEAQDKATGGWRYYPRERGGDTSVVGWQVMALKSAKTAGLQVAADTEALAVRWLDRVQYEAPQTGNGVGSRYGYDKSQGGSWACTAVGLLCRPYLGTVVSDRGLQMGIQRIAAQGPSLKGDATNIYYNYYATMLMYQNYGPHGYPWDSWNRRLRDYMLQYQKQDGDDRGSWFFSGGWGKDGGRLYVTCMVALTLQVYYRYPLTFYATER